MKRDEIYHRNRPSRIKSEVASPSKLVYPIIKQCASCCAAVPQLSRIAKGADKGRVAAIPWAMQVRARACIIRISTA